MTFNAGRVIEDVADMTRRNAKLLSDLDGTHLSLQGAYLNNLCIGEFQRDSTISEKSPMDNTRGTGT